MATTTKSIALLLCSIGAAATMRAAPMEGLSWSDGSDYITISGSTLTITRDAAATGAILSKAALDLTGLTGEGLGLLMTIRVRAEGVTEPASSATGGVKFMLAYRDSDDGEMHYVSAAIPSGTYDWRTVTNRVNILTAPFNPEPGTAVLHLGLQGCTGRVDFDLSSLDVSAEDVGVTPVNQDYIVRYPDDDCSQFPHCSQITNANCNLPFVNNCGQLSIVNNQPLRGFMSPQRDMTEDDLDTLRSWGATLVRFQLTSSWSGTDTDQDLDEYFAWLDSRLDNLEDVLRWAAARGMKVCVDLHSPPGGKRVIDGVRTMNMFFEERFAEAFLETWRRIARRVKGHPAIYGYDLVNEPNQRVPAPFSYWELQRRAAEAVRAIDPDTAIVVESNLGDNAEAYRYLSPLAMDNVIYQVHLYKPYEFTHQGINGNPLSDSSGPLAYPSRERGWDHDFLRAILAPVRAFQEKHRCRIYAGEFSSASWAPGADLWLRDCIDLFEEYGWDWTYHAFRESTVFSIEHEPIDPGRVGDYNFVASEDNPRRSTLLDGLIRAPGAPWFAWGYDTNGVEIALGGLRDGSGGFAASERRGGIARVEMLVAATGGYEPERLTELLAEAMDSSCAAAVICAEETDGSLALRGLATDAGGAPAWLRLEGFAPTPGEEFLVVAELDATNGVGRVRYAAANWGASESQISNFKSQIYFLRTAAGDTWLPSPGGLKGLPAQVGEGAGQAQVGESAGQVCASAVQTAGKPAPFEGRVAVKGDVAVGAIVGAAPPPAGPPAIFGPVSIPEAPCHTNAVATLRIETVGEQVAPGAVLRMEVHSGVPSDAAGAFPEERLLGVVEMPLAGPGDYRFDTAGAIDPAAFDGLLSCRVVFSLVNADGTIASGVAAVEDSLPFYEGKRWFLARARGGRGFISGGAWQTPPPALSGDAMTARPEESPAFLASKSRGGFVRLEAVFTPLDGYDEVGLGEALAAAAGSAAAVAVAEDDAGALSFRGLALVDGAPAWVPLAGGAPPAAGVPIRIVAEIDCTGGEPRVSYLAARGGAGSPDETPARLHGPGGAVWLPSPGGLESRPAQVGEDAEQAVQVAGGVAFSGSAPVASFAGHSAVKYHPPKPFAGTLFILQ
ncbi:MAG: cellulase family glycosylhydrolase [Kiritimatiellae bacterium]|nr:cellulase family glycosylhydrolase [Kiritimatiellia bacterium]